MKALRRALGRLGVPVAAWLVRLLAVTLRIRRDEHAVAALLASRTPLIVAIWHSRILLPPVVYGRRLPLRALVSRSRDGEIVARYLGCLGVGAVRGSSSRGGLASLRGLARVLAEGASVIVVPDGPRGPREVLKPGIIALARLTGAPIVPLAVGCTREWQLDSWDAFRIPKPFSRCLVRVGAPIRVSDDDMLKQVEAALRALTWQVDEEMRR